jgi:hypothetical protein
VAEVAKAAAAADAAACRPARKTLPIQHVLAVGFSQLAFTLIQRMLQKVT